MAQLARRDPLLRARRTREDTLHAAQIPLKRENQGEENRDRDQREDRKSVGHRRLVTIVGKVDYAPNGEWKDPRVLWVQYQNVKGNGLEQFKKPGTQVIVYPKGFASGQLLLPYSEGR